MAVRGRAKRIIVKTLAAAALTALVFGTFAAYLYITDRSSADSESEAAVDTGPKLDGTFYVDFGPLAGPDGEPIPGSSRSEMWVARSACGDNGCIATVSLVDPESPEGPPKDTMVLDYIGKEWVLVKERPGKCDTGNPEIGTVDAQSWSIITLTPRLDETMTGVYTWVTSPELCATRQAVSVRPTHAAGDEVAPPDPAEQPPRVVSPAAGLWGTYTYTQTYPKTGEVFPSHTYSGRTYCLRTGDRCLTFMTNPDTNSVLSMTFADGHWSATLPSGEGKCSDDVGKVQRTSVDDFPLPHGPQNPIMLLVGKTVQTFTGDCPGTAELDVRLQRTGD